ncbi:hypothetical protein [Candidatus Poriferisocius sp.]|uniref:hypothetical protein n=1 Tax=Candidatus Poriferisocius sp. TaxID=3101276 RepID=UPI003B0146F5
MSKRLSTFSKRLSTMSKRLSTFSKRLSTMSKRLSTFSKRLSTMSKRLSTFSKRLSTMSKRLSTFSKRLSTMSKRLSTFSKRLSTLPDSPNISTRSLFTSCSSRSSKAFRSSLVARRSQGTGGRDSINVSASSSPNCSPNRFNRAKRLVSSNDPLFDTASPFNKPYPREAKLTASERSPNHTPFQPPRKQNPGSPDQ